MIVGALRWCLPALLAGGLLLAGAAGGAGEGGVRPPPKEAAPGCRAIVLLAGSYEERVGVAARLYLSGRAPTIIVANDGVRRGWSNKYQRNLYSTERIEEALAQMGVPRRAVVALPYYQSGTIYDALAVKRYLLGHRIRHIYVVTSDYHARRAEWVFHRVLPQGITCSIYPANAPSHLFLSLVIEPAKLLYYRGRYGLLPPPELPE